MHFHASSPKWYGMVNVNFSIRLFTTKVVNTYDTLYIQQD